LRGSEIAEKLKDIENRVSNLATSDIPRRVLNIEGDVKKLQQEVPNKVSRNVFGPISADVVKLQQTMATKAN
jgi:hypothetical protein